MLKKHLIVVLLAVTVPCLLFAQDDQFYSVFSMNNRWINPSTTDLDSTFLSADLTSKYQTKNLGGDLYAGVFDISIKTKNRKHCFGFVYDFDKTNYQKLNSIYFNWSYSLIFNESKLSIGAAMGLVKHTSYDDGLNMILPGGNLPSGSFGAITYDIDLGMHFERKNLSLGISINHIDQPVIRYKLGNSNQTYLGFLDRAICFQSQYKIPISERLSLNVLGLLRFQHPQSIIYTRFIDAQSSYLDQYIFYRNNTSASLFTIGGEIVVSKKYICGVSYAGADKEINHIGIELGYLIKTTSIRVNYFLPNSIRGNAIEVGARFVI